MIWVTSLKKLAPPPYNTVQPGYQTVGDYGRPGEWVAEGPPVTVKMRQLTGDELVAAGVTTTRRYYRMWTDEEVTFSEAKTLRSEEYGDLETQSIVEYPERGITVIEASRIATA